MKSTQNSNRGDFTPAHKIDEMIDYGRQLHAEAVFLGALKIVELFRRDFRKTIQLPEAPAGQINLKYSQQL